MKIRYHLAVAFVVFGATHATAQTKDQVIAAECTTDATGVDGRRKACDSAWTVISAPDGYVFAKETLSGGEASANGSEHECRVKWGKQEEILPGSKIMQPTELSLQAHARSPKGHASGRGWEKCKYSVTMSKYK
ncbi:hypothetical protein E0H47_31600 [Rhizobium leguminosarum bv. viciae]|uniref:hypothetical protein n=1 Tax=Rhizobium leguminosarum TaxID=384 RepID=UPI00103DC4BE|nr:hypothetical protein [Rhizobium leguminosarum]TBZ30951.1 hypothetical protein E0H47_31600 [Rhizobium leguminosarum bv. viciae]